MTLWKWSQTAASDATADSTINWAEGQAPSSVNDSARAMMAAMAKYRDDVNGAIVATGTSSAYAITSNQGFDTLAHLKPQEFTFICPATNAAGVTLNIDSLGAQPINGVDGTAIPAGTLVLGGVYTVTAYTGEFVLHGFYGNPYNIPIGGGMDYWGSTVPNSNFVFPIGQAISRATYSTLFGIIGTTYGVGDGSTTFNLPDKTGRVSAMKEATATRLTTATVGVDGATLGSAGGGSQTLVTANLPPYTPAGSISVVSTISNIFRGTLAIGLTGGGAVTGSGDIAAGSVTSTGSLTGTAQGGTSTPIKIAQPTIICNYILRII